MHENKDTLILPPWLDSLRPVIGIGLFVVAPIYLGLLFYYGGSPRSTDVGYQPAQPVPYSHALHAGELGIDCRYCHNTVERAAHAAIPPTDTCMNCHTGIYPDSPLLVAVRESHSRGHSIPWVRVHDLPDYVFFDHSAHVTRGVGCVECHGRVDKMEVVYQVEPLSMGWCLDCHRNPAGRLRPRDRITDMAWTPTTHAGPPHAERLNQEYGIEPSEDCSTCHR